MSPGKVAVLVAVAAAAQGIVAFGFAGSASASPSTTPSISTTQQPSTATVGSSIADKATVSGTAPGTTYACPPQDEAGFPVATYSITGTTLFCSYPAFPGENPTDFYCNYDTGTGILTKDNDAGFCPGSAVATSGGGPTGTVTFNLYNNPNGTGTPLFSDTESLSGGSATSKGYTATAAGTDYWVATYNGDSNFSAVSSTANGEPVTLNMVTPSVSTTASSGSVTVGQPISDQASVTGGFNPTGTVTFSLYSNDNCLVPPLFTDTEGLSTGSATSASYTTTASGTDYWVAFYNGDGNNNPTGSSCSAEPVLVNPATPSVSTTASATTVKVGRTIADKASVTGGFNPTGTVTFSLYSNDSCTGPALFSATASLSGGSATSGVYRTTSTGTDYWVATYNGDTNNNSTSSSCSAEPVIVNRATPTVSAHGVSSNTRARPGRVTYVVWVNGRAGIPPTGSVTVSDGTQTCNITSLSNRHGQCSIVETASGTYSITASYAGDSNYEPATATFTETIN